MQDRSDGNRSGSCTSIDRISAKCCCLGNGPAVKAGQHISDVEDP